MSLPLLTAPSPQYVPDRERLVAVARPSRPDDRPKSPADQQFFVEWEVSEAS